MPYYPPASGGAPSGSASGDLGGTYPSPTVVAKRSALAATGTLFETIPRGYNAASLGNNATYLVSQRLSLVAIELPSGLTVTSITFVSSGTPLGTGNHQFFGLYDDSAGSSGGAALALLRGTADGTSGAWAAQTAKTMNLTSTYATTRAGLFYLGILVDATTVPSFQCSTGSQATAYGNAATTLPIISAISSTGVTALPNPAGALTTATSIPWAWVS